MAVDRNHSCGNDRDFNITDTIDKVREYLNNVILYCGAQVRKATRVPRRIEYHMVKVAICLAT